jgi:uncharacterized metal-binding protein/predicted Fe-Mo cluster-binding NifX family protein
MRVAVPLFGRRVAPRCLTAREMLVALVEDDQIRATEELPLEARDEEGLIDRLLVLGVDVLVCGGIGRDLENGLRANAIGVVNNVAGEVDEVLAVLCRGRLTPGWGLGPAGRGPARPKADRRVEPLPSVPLVDCVACEDRSCRRTGWCPTGNGAFAGLTCTPAEAALFDIGRDVASEDDPKLCRIAELVHFGLGMGYRRVGLAFCRELFEETETLTRVLSRFFTVVPVCCRVGLRPGADGAEPHSCNPVAQAAVLSAARTDLNVVVGLCLGADLVFNERSRAPVTTLFVKDRSLAHNPVGAIYTRYHLEKLGGDVRPSGRPRRRTS